MAILIGLSPVWTIAKDRATTQDTTTGTTINHEIVKIKDLIKDFNESTWTVVTESGSQLNSNEDGIARVSQEEIRGYWNTSGQFVESDDLECLVIEVNAQPVSEDKINQVHGSYTIQLPTYKRLQVEMMYELNVDESEEIPQGEFCLEIYERNRANLDEWVKMGHIVQEKELKQEKPSIKTQKDKMYAMYSYVANISEWSGKEIRMDLISDFVGSEKNTNKGRWTCARVMGSTFDFHFLTIDEKDEGVVLPQSKTFRRILPDTINQDSQDGNHPTDYDWNGGTVYNAEATTIAGLINFPESFPVATITNPGNNYFVGYFQAGIPHYNEDGWNGTGTVVCNLAGTSSNFYNATSANINDSMIRDYSGTLYRSSNSNYPVWRALAPVRDKTHWANGMTAVGSVFKEGSYVHAVFHAEDWYKNPPTKNQDNDPSTNDFWAYCRIGYARSNENDLYHLNITASSDDDPIITCFQAEDQLSKDEYAGGAVFGAAHPLLLKHGSYFYLYYNRFYEYGFTSYVPKSQGGIGREGCTLCIARALYSDVIDSQYTTNTNPWTKRYGGSYSQPGLGGYDTPFFDFADLSPHWGYLVPVGVMDHSGIGEYLYAFWNPHDGHHTNEKFYLGLSNGKTPESIGNLIEVTLPTTYTCVVGMVSPEGYNNQAVGHYLKIFTHEPATGYGMVRYTLYLDY